MATKVKFSLPRSVWTAKDSARLANDTLASIKLRTSKGIDANGEAFKAYSQEPIYVSKRGARLKPKGGQASRTGQSIYYEGGYQQYKHDSRRRSSLAGSADVDLVLSGNMMNNLVVKKATNRGFSIGLTNKAGYGYYVNIDREFLGLSEDDVNILIEAVSIELGKKLT
jgi:hypothetical protein